MKEFSSKDLIESFGYTQLNEFTASDAWDAAKGIAGSDETKSLAKTVAAGAVAGKAASKLAGRAIPGVGTALSWKDAYDRWQAGDRSGAVISALAGGAYLIPGVGTAAGLGLDAINIGRDISADDSEKSLDPVSSPSNADKLAALQNIIGANPDGIMGPETKEKLKAWQKEQGIKDDGIPGPETYATAGLEENKGIKMKQKTIAEDIASLRDRLRFIENEELINEANPVGITKEIWNIVKTGVYNVDDIIKALAGKFGELPGDIRQQVEYAVNNVGKKIPTTTGNKGLAKAGDTGELAKTGAKSGEYIGKSQQTGGLTTKTGQVIDGEIVDKVSTAALSSPKISAAEKEAIKSKGILNWLKANPTKASLISGAAGLLVGLGLSGDSNSNISAQPAPTKTKKGDSEVMDRQRILNDLGANIKVDGIWGPETEAAYQEYWVKNFAKHNALATGASPEEAEKRQANWNAASKMGGTSTSEPTTQPENLGLVPGEGKLDPSKFSDSYKALTNQISGLSKQMGVQPPAWPDINAANRDWRPSQDDINRAREKMAELLLKGNSLTNADYAEIERELEKNRPAYIQPPISQQLSDLKSAEDNAKNKVKEDLARIKALSSYKN